MITTKLGIIFFSLLSSTAHSHNDSHFNLSKEDIVFMDAFKDTKDPWALTPNIFVCEDSPVKKEHVQMAKTFWENKGFQLGKVVEISQEKCNLLYKTEQIIIINKKQDFLDETNYFAMTKRKSGLICNQENKTELVCDGKQGKFMKSAIIEIADDIYESGKSTEIIVHELGHALGLDHNDNNKNVMNTSFF